MRGWEAGILRFLSARFAERHGFWRSVRDAVQASVRSAAWTSGPWTRACRPALGPANQGGPAAPTAPARIAGPRRSMLS